MLYKNRCVRSPEDGYQLLKQFLGDTDREYFVVVCLDIKNQPTAINICHIGSLNASIVHPRECFKPAILSNTASILVGHNHPRGSSVQSREGTTEFNTKKFLNGKAGVQASKASGKILSQENFGSKYSITLGGTDKAELDGALTAGKDVKVDITAKDGSTAQVADLVGDGQMVTIPNGYDGAGLTLKVNGASLTFTV